MIYMAITIYIVYHKTFENTNVFFTTKEKALQYIEKVALVKYPEEEITDWNIRELEEGCEFDAQMWCF